jgi:hypothetical protein
LTGSREILEEPTQPVLGTASELRVKMARIVAMTESASKIDSLSNEGHILGRYLLYKDPWLPTEPVRWREPEDQCWREGDLALRPWSYPADVNDKKKDNKNTPTLDCASDHAAMITPIVNRITEIICKRE